GEINSSVVIDITALGSAGHDHGRNSTGPEGGIKIAVGKISDGRVQHAALHRVAGLAGRDDLPIRLQNDVGHAFESNGYAGGGVADYLSVGAEGCVRRSVGVKPGDYERSVVLL